ncbi:MAG: extracellular solute-binding protein family 1 [Acidimicrobiaceae bacterium]|nr:extracellular solute-binding protein family 1 [Acidimicrobiaceae bacterium]
MRKTSKVCWFAGIAGSAMALVAAVAPASGASLKSHVVIHATCNWATATSLASCGGMSALVAAAKAEGQLNVITLPKNWANYGTIMTDFTKKYGIKIADANPDGSSQDEINAMVQLKGQKRAPDVLDMGTSFAVKADQEHLLAPYKVASWSSISATAKAADATWFDDYGGYVAIGYDPSKVKVAPTSFASLTNPAYKNMIAMNGNPTQAGAAFAAVYAAALANKGSYSNIAPGVQYFANLKKIGNFVPVTGSAATVESGQTPILIWWDYLLASEVQPSVKGFKIVVPSDAHYAGYYSQAISKSAPNPAAARLWEEYLYSVTGQNLWLDGKARPIELPALVANHTVNATAYKALPAVQGTGSLVFASTAQVTKAEAVVASQWSSAIGG